MSDDAIRVSRAALRSALIGFGNANSFNPESVDGAIEVLIDATPQNPERPFTAAELNVCARALREDVAEYRRLYGHYRSRLSALSSPWLAEYELLACKLEAEASESGEQP